VLLVFVSLLCCHWCGCLWWMISDLELNENELVSPRYAGPNNWHPPPWLINEPSLTTKYMHAFFWGAGMVTSMVPRDIEPVTTIEAVVTTFTMFFGLMLNAYVISSMTSAIASMNAKRELAGKQLNQIRNYLILKAVPIDLRSRILEYFQYLYTSSQSLASMEMFDNMPDNLTAQLALSVNRKIAGRCAFFRDVSNASLVTLISDLQPYVYVPGQMVVVEGLPLTHAYFINRGLVKVMGEGRQLGTLTDNDNFGLDDFLASCLTNHPPHVRRSVEAVTYCDMMLLPVERLRAATSIDPIFQEKVQGLAALAATGSERLSGERCARKRCSWNIDALRRSQRGVSSEDSTAADTTTPPPTTPDPAADHSAPGAHAERSRAPLLAAEQSPRPSIELAALHTPPARTGRVMFAEDGAGGGCGHGAAPALTALVQCGPPICAYLAPALAPGGAGAAPVPAPLPEDDEPKLSPVVDIGERQVAAPPAQSPSPVRTERSDSSLRA